MSVTGTRVYFEGTTRCPVCSFPCGGFEAHGGSSAWCTSASHANNMRPSSLTVKTEDGKDAYLFTHRVGFLQKCPCGVSHLHSGAVLAAGANGHAPRIEPMTPVADLPSDAPAEAFHGLFDRLTDLIDPYVESDRTSVLVQLMAAFGTAVGVGPVFMVGATRHPPRIYLGLIGRSSRSRKGTGWDPVETLISCADPSFSSRMKSGIGSGEKLVHLVRDPEPDELEAIRKGEAMPIDKRLLIREAELAQLLVVVNREGSTLSAKLREAFDGKGISNEVKNLPGTARSHAIGMVGHCTEEEIRGKLTEQQIRNGLANRILWVLARRSKKLPDPPIFDVNDRYVAEAIEEVAIALQRARSISLLRRSAAAQKIWADWYEALPDDEFGLVAAITARAEAQVIRLAEINALSDGTGTVESEHLCAALALWEHSVGCAQHIWGRTTGNPMADRILADLAYGPMFQTDLHDETFQKNISGEKLEELGRLLEGQGRIARERVHTGQRGRPPIRWRRLR